MPGLFRPAPLAATLLLVLSAVVTPALAEMTEADREGMRVFAVCLDENGGDEEGCVEKLGRFAWYPRNEATCETVGARVNKIIGLGGDPVWRDLFQNERCARLGMPYGAGGLPSPPNSATGRRFRACREKLGWVPCIESFGRHEDHYTDSEGICEGQAFLLSKPNADLQLKWWRRWFENERCWRLGGAHFDTTSAHQPDR